MGSLFGGSLLIVKTSIMKHKIWHKKNIIASVLAVLLFISLLSVGLWSLTTTETEVEETKPGNEDTNQFLDLTEDEFREVFGLPPVDDLEEKGKRAETLKKHQQVVLENNKAYLAGERTWFEGIDEFSDIPDDEFIATHTGLIENPEQFN